MPNDLTAWEFYVCCYTSDTSIWTRWRWRCMQNEKLIEPQSDFATLQACKADAVLHGFDPSSSSCQIDWRDTLLDPSRRAPTRAESGCRSARECDRPSS